MLPEDVLALSREAIITLLKISLPALLAALVVGVVISLIQALTQIQEMTLTFIPKILVIFVVLLLCAPMMGSLLNDYANLIFEKVSTI